MNNRILVIDDEKEILDDYIHILTRDVDNPEDSLVRIARELGYATPTLSEKSGEYYIVSVSKTGEHGVYLAEQAVKGGNPFAVVFCDMRMPGGIDGLETGKRIRKIDKQVEIVLVTGYSDHRRSEIVKELGDPEKLLYLKKPFDPDEIRQLALKLTKSWQMEQNLKQALEKAKAADLAKSDFLSMVTHELKTPLTGIIGSVQTLKNLLAGGKTASNLKFMDMIESSAFRLLDMVNDILAFSRSQSHRDGLRIEPFNLEEFFSTLFEDEIEPLLKGKNIKVSFEVPDINIQADKTKLRHIIMNLASNAIKFTSSGTVRIACSTSSSGHFSFTVSDTGRGIPRDKYNKIFDEFYQVDRNTDEQQGSGLGLAIVKRYVQLHGGSISVESSLGKGTTFRFAIPVTTVKDEKLTGVGS